MVPVRKSLQSVHRRRAQRGGATEQFLPLGSLRDRGGVRMGGGSEKASGGGGGVEDGEKETRLELLIIWKLEKVRRRPLGRIRN